MTNKLRRSMTSVLLAASLLFSSQSVVAFADYGSKSDASDLSPVQESVENATEEQQEDPSLSVEPVIGESTEAPVAAPMMARANAPVAYSAPTPKPGYEELTAYTALAEDCQLHVYINSASAGNIDLINSNALDEVFPQGTGFRVFESKPNSEWVFDKWETNVFLDGTIHNINESNPTGVATGVYCFSDPSNKNTPYNSESNQIRVNRVTGLLEDISHNIYYSVYANFNPLVTVNYDNNQGSVTADKPHGNNKFEAEYAQDKVFTITPNSGYEVASVTADGIVIPVDENGKCTLTSVIEPTTLYVEFEKAEDVITVDDIDGAVIVTVACDNLPEHTHQYSLKANGEENENYEITVEKANETATLHLLKDGWLHTFVSQPGFGNHQLSDDSSNLINIQLTFDKDSGEWKLPENAKRYDVTIKVKCSDVQEKVVVYACYDGVMEKQPIFQGKASHGSKLIDYLKEKELKIKEGYTIEEGWYKKDSFPNEYLFNESDTVSGWTNVYVKCFKNPDENIINNLLDVTLNCENPDHPEEYGKSKTYSDLLANSYIIGEVKNNDGTYTCDITINPEEYLADYNNVTKTNHILVTTPENLAGIATVTLKYEDGAWKTAESPVTFTVTCKQSIPLTPSKPSDDDVKAIMDKISVTVDCTNTTGHDPMNHTLTGAEFTVGDIYSVAPFAGKDPVILCPVTINNYASLQNGFITQYNAATNESHTLSSGFIPASIVLTYNKDAQDGKGAWENHDLENITLSLTCNPTTPGGGGEGTNPGGNGGDNDDDDDRYTGGNTVTRTINDDDVPLNDRPTNTTTIDDEDVPLADLPDDTVTIDDGEVPLKANPSTGDSLPFAAMAAAALSLGGVIVLNRKKK